MESVILYFTHSIASESVYLANLPLKLCLEHKTFPNYANMTKHEKSNYPILVHWDYSSVEVIIIRHMRKISVKLFLN